MLQRKRSACVLGVYRWAFGMDGFNALLLHAAQMACVRWERVTGGVVAGARGW